MKGSVHPIALCHNRDMSRQKKKRSTRDTQRAKRTTKTRSRGRNRAGSQKRAGDATRSGGHNQASNRNRASAQIQTDDQIKTRNRKQSSGHVRADEQNRADNYVSHPRVCPLSAECGGCSHIEEPYAHQLKRKQYFITELFADDIKAGCTLEPIIGMEDPFGFRNKIASPFAPVRSSRTGKRVRHTKSGDATLQQDTAARQRKTSVNSLSRLRPGSSATSSIRYGLYAAGTHCLIRADKCLVEHPIGRRVVAATAQLMRKWNIAPYDEDAGTGFMRHVVVRVGHESGEVLVTLVTNDKVFPSGKSFARHLKKRCPEITTVVQNVNMRSTNAIFGGEEQVLYGPGFILDTLCGLSFRISSHSFYQVNAVQTEVLYRTALEMAACTSSHQALTILDAYCGTGTIGLVAASQVPNSQVIGIDNTSSSIRDARQNAAHNGIANAMFLCEDATDFLLHRAAASDSIDVLMMDPPRAGSTSEFIEAACALAPERVVYISCNPATQKRDVRLFARGGYRLVHLRAVDMFPHTDHIETVALLMRNAEFFAQS